MPIRRRLIVAAALMALALCAQAGGKGWLGISLSVDGEGAFWNPTLRAVRIAKVAPGSPASLAGIAKGDLIVEIEGNPVAGARANDLQSYLQREVGQEVRMVLRKASGEVRPVSMVTGTRPE